MSILIISIIWLVLLLAAIINGIIREKYLNTILGLYWAHIISTLMLCIIILTISSLCLTFLHSHLTGFKPGWVGLYWTVMTVLFEFTYGHFIAQKSWQLLIQDYNILQGRIWVLVLLTLLLSPFITL